MSTYYKSPLHDSTYLKTIFWWLLYVRLYIYIYQGCMILFSSSVWHQNWVFKARNTIFNCMKSCKWILIDFDSLKFFSLNSWKVLKTHNTLFLHSLIRLHWWFPFGQVPKPVTTKTRYCLNPGSALTLPSVSKGAPGTLPFFHGSPAFLSLWWPQYP